MIHKQSKFIQGILAWLFLLAALGVAVLLFRLAPSFYLWEPVDWSGIVLAWNLAALLVIVTWTRHSARALTAGEHLDQVFAGAVGASIVFMLFFVACLALGKYPMPGRRRLVTFFMLSPVALCAARLVAQALDRCIRRHFGHRRTAAFVGSTPALETLRRALEAEGVRGEEWTFETALASLKATPCEELYCSLAQETLPQAQTIFDYCENHLVRFYGVPETSDFLGRNLVKADVGDVPVLMPREEPLRRLSNRILKRTLDIVLSLGFLTTLFVPILAVVAWKIKRESPGPVFFRQRRHGLDGCEFKCWKFRSMHVNDQSDTAQTAKDDPRKFPFGDFMRRTNIDELPQFINVLTGEMSVVGPRPHPCKMTDDFGAVVNRYRVRLYAKPGVTGWAQVNGARGAALELADMVKRVRLDIWYLEHWTFGLDLRIIFETFWQTVRGKNKNAF